MKLLSIHSLIRDRLLQRAGLWEFPHTDTITLEQLTKEVTKDTWREEFFELMFNRLLMGRLRYGKRNVGNKKYNYIKSIKDKLALYEATGNSEALVDIGNYALIAFYKDDHPNKHFSALDDKIHADVKS